MIAAGRLNSYEVVQIWRFGGGEDYGMYVSQRSLHSIILSQ